MVRVFRFCLVIVFLLIISKVLLFITSYKTQFYLAQKSAEGKLITLSSIPQNTECDRPYKFYIPQVYEPVYGNNENRYEYFTFKIKAPLSGIPLNKVGATDLNIIRVTVKVTDRTFVYLKDIEDGDLFPIGKAPPYIIYENGNSKHSRIFYGLEKDDNGFPYFIYSDREGFFNFVVQRRVSKYLEIKYFISRKVPIEQWQPIDKYIINLINSFQRSCQCDTRCRLCGDVNELYR